MQSSNNNEISKFFILAKEKFKNQSSWGSSPSCLLYNKKIIISILNRYEEILTRVNGMVENIDFEKNTMQSFLLQYAS